MVGCFFRETRNCVPWEELGGDPLLAGWLAGWMLLNELTVLFVVSVKLRECVCVFFLHSD